MSPSAPPTPLLPVVLQYCIVKLKILLLAILIIAIIPIIAVMLVISPAYAQQQSLPSPHSIALELSQAYTAMANHNLPHAAQIAFTLNAASSTPPFKDIGFILGTIHLQEKLYPTAITYYEKLPHLNAPWLIKENAVLLHYNLSQAYYHAHQPKKQIIALETLLATFPPNQDAFTSTYRYKAHFILALAYWAFEAKAKSLPHLYALLRSNKAIYANILLTYYYATTPQNTIAADYFTYLKQKDSIANTPQRQPTFIYYYKQLQTNLETISFQNTPIAPYRKFFPAINTYYKTMTTAIATKRTEDNLYLQTLQTPQTKRPAPAPTSPPTPTQPTTNKLNSPPTPPPNLRPPPQQSPQNLPQNPPTPPPTLNQKQQNNIQSFTSKIDELYKNNDSLFFLK